MTDKPLPPGITVQHFGPGEPITPNKGSVHPTTIIQPNVPQPDTVPPVQPISPDGTELESGAELEGQVQSGPPTGQEIVPSIPALAGEVEVEPNAGEVVITGTAALIMAKMLDLDYVWNINTGEALSLADAQQNPGLAFIDFEALRESAENMDSDVIAELMNALPMQAPSVTQDPAQTKASRDAFTKGPAGPGVTVRHIPGLIHVEVEGPVTLSKAKVGETRILKVKYVNVQTPTGHAGVKPQGVQVKRGHIKNPHQVTHRKMKPIAQAQPRTIPRRPVAPPSPPFEPEQVHEEHIDEEDF